MGNRRKVSWTAWGTWTLVALLVAYPLCYPVVICLLSQAHFGLMILAHDHSAVPDGVPIWCHRVVWSFFSPVDDVLSFTPDWFQEASDGYFNWWMAEGLQATDIPSSGESWCGMDSISLDSSCPDPD